MADDAEDKSLDATPKRLQQAREEGDVAVSREGSAAGVYLAALLGIMLLGGGIAAQVGTILLPMLDQPEAFLGTTSQGWQAAGHAVFTAIALLLLPFFGLLSVGALLPHLLQNAITLSGKRLAPKLSNISPSRGASRMFGLRALFEFGKSLTKLAVVGAGCWMVARPLYEESMRLVTADLSVLPDLLLHAVGALLLMATLVATVIAGIDVPYQHWSWRRRLRMSLQEVRDEMRNTEGDPHVKMRQRKLRHQGLRRRMLTEVPAATVVLANPTHYAVALRYERGKDAAPVVVAKGRDQIALRIREVAVASNVPIVENPPLARALYGSAEIGDIIPREHFETVARIIGLIWARTGQPPKGGSRQPGPR